MNQKALGRILIVLSFAWIGVAATLVTGFLVYVASTVGLYSGHYGFPLSWRYWAEIAIIQYSWFAFVVDVLFYMATGYGLLLALRKLEKRPSIPHGA